MFLLVDCSLHFPSPQDVMLQHVMPQQTCGKGFLNHASENHLVYKTSCRHTRKVGGDPRQEWGSLLGTWTVEFVMILQEICVWQVHVQCILCRLLGH